MSLMCEAWERPSYQRRLTKYFIHSSGNKLVNAVKTHSDQLIAPNKHFNQITKTHQRNNNCVRCDKFSLQT